MELAIILVTLTLIALIAMSCKKRTKMYGVCHKCGESDLPDEDSDAEEFKCPECGQEHTLVWEETWDGEEEHAWQQWEAD